MSRQWTSSLWSVAGIAAGVCTAGLLSQTALAAENLPLCSSGASLLPPSAGLPSQLSGMPVAVHAATPQTPTTPRSVRSTGDLQVGGVSLGTRAKPEFQGRAAEPPTVWSLHGNPTAIVVPLPKDSAAPSQKGSSPQAVVPTWASTVMVPLDNNHTEWLYKRAGYVMGFVINRAGYVDAIIVAGLDDASANTRVSDAKDRFRPLKLGEDVRKTLFALGYPDTVQTFDAAGQRVGKAESAKGSDKLSKQARESQQDGGNGTKRLFELRYESTYNAVFTVQNNHIARIYLFSKVDPAKAVR